MSKIQGHGIPTKFKAAEKGTVYTDLDTGRRYECLGTARLINVDVVDEPVEYKWKLINQINPNQLPEPLQFGSERTVMGDTLTWDGNTEGLYCIMDGSVCCVSDIIPTMEELQNGGTITINENGESITAPFTGENVIDANLVGLGTDLIIIGADNCSALIATKDCATATNDTETIEIGKAGVYFEYDLSNGMWCESLTINGYNGFPRTEIVTIDPKYIKDMYYETPEVWDNIALISDNWSDKATCKLDSTSIEWAANNSYRVRVDGIEYEFSGMTEKKGQHNAFSDPPYWIGAEYYLLLSNIDFTDYPFSFVTTDFTNVYAVFEDGTTNHTVEILKSDAVIHPIPEKYLPSEYDMVVKFPPVSMMSQITPDNVVIESGSFDNVKKKVLNGDGVNVLIKHTYTSGGSTFNETNILQGAYHREGYQTSITGVMYSTTGGAFRIELSGNGDTIENFNAMSV